MLLLVLSSRLSNTFKLPLTTDGTAITHASQAAVSASSTLDSAITHTTPSDTGSSGVSLKDDASRFTPQSLTSESPITTQSLLEEIVSSSTLREFGSDSSSSIAASGIINVSLSETERVTSAADTSSSARSTPGLLSLLQTPSTPRLASHTIEASDDVATVCSSRDAMWTNPCGPLRRRRGVSDTDRDLAARLDGIQHYANDSIKVYILTEYIKEDYLRGQLQGTPVPIFPRIASGHTYNDKLTALVQTLYTFVANLNYMQSCGLTAIPEATLSQRLDGLKSRVYQTLCSTDIAVIHAGLHTAAPSSESVMSERVRAWANSGTSEMEQLQAVYFTVKDLEKVAGMMKELLMKQ